MFDMAVVILAGGESSRFGSCKLLAQFANKPLLQHSIDIAVETVAEHVYVVTGAWHQEIEEAFSQGALHGAKRIYNPQWKKGMSTSIVIAIESLQSRYHSVLFLLADQVALTTQDLQQLIAGWRDHNTVCSVYNGRRGVPAIFSSSRYSELLALQGDKGAKLLLEAKQVVACDLPNAAIDVDTPEDLANIEAPIL